MDRTLHLKGSNGSVPRRSSLSTQDPFSAAAAALLLRAPPAPLALPGPPEPAGSASRQPRAGHSLLEIVFFFSWESPEKFSFEDALHILEIVSSFHFYKIVRFSHFPGTPRITNNYCKTLLSSNNVQKVSKGVSELAKNPY